MDIKLMRKKLKENRMTYEDLTKEQKEKIDGLWNALSDEVSEAAASYYREGFKEGFKLACEIYGITEPEDR